MIDSDLVWSGNRVVGSLSDGSEIPKDGSPRPYLHGVRTAAGVWVTQTGADDHPHHRGWSLAVPDVDGVSYWGGRTYVRETGSTMLENHGVQRLVRDRRERHASGTSVEQAIDWVAPAKILQLTEQRRISVTDVPAADQLASGDVVLAWQSTLTSEHRVTIGSPATNGRDGAFYGGLFWRTPFLAATALVQEGSGTEVAHGSSSPWCAITTPAASLVFVQHGEARPWFVRTDGYVGVCQSLARTERLVLEPGEPLYLAVSVFVSDRGNLTSRQARDVASRLNSSMGAAA